MVSATGTYVAQVNMQRPSIHWDGYACPGLDKEQLAWFLVPGQRCYALFAAIGGSHLQVSKHPQGFIATTAGTLQLGINLLTRGYSSTNEGGLHVTARLRHSE